MPAVTSRIGLQRLTGNRHKPSGPPTITLHRRWAHDVYTFRFNRMAQALVYHSFRTDVLAMYQLGTVIVVYPDPDTGNLLSSGHFSDAITARLIGEAIRLEPGEQRTWPLELGVDQDGVPYLTFDFREGHA